jgi:deoxyribodipyrimidine photo-lyase
LVWFRQDLRLGDNPALATAAASGRPVIGVFVLDDVSPGPWSMGGASRWWLDGALRRLREGLDGVGIPLVLRRGDCEVEIPRLVAEAKAAGVYWNRCYEPFARRRDEALKTALTKAGIDARSFKASLLFEPWEVRTKTGGDFKVFSPFLRACLAKGVEAVPLPVPQTGAPSAWSGRSDALEDWALTPSAPDWAGGLRATWTPGEAGARARLEAFILACAGYGENRNRPDLEATSRLSPHLHFGEISPLQVWCAIAHLEHGDADKFRSEIIWREFATHLLYHFPDLPERHWNATFDAFPWREDAAFLRAWQKGQTGIPIVDAGMRELWTTGYMHNRVRMIVASFLTKHGLIDWRAGEAWFWDTLVDADLANNSASWQWVAGSGADAAPFFRIFNPVTQSEKFDPDGVYVRRWVPEVRALPNTSIHAPWTATNIQLNDANVSLGKSYPAPIVDLANARQRALAAFNSLKQAP